MFGRGKIVPICLLLIGELIGFGQTPIGGKTGNEAGRRTVLILGDSLAAGYGVDPDAAFPALLQAKVDSAGMPVMFVNAGVSGDTSAGGLRRINWLLRQPVDVLVLELGGNDGLRGIQPGTTRTNLQQIIDRTREKNPAVRIVIAGMRMPENMGEEFTRGFREMFFELAAANKATLIPFLLEGVGGNAELNQPDLIHPNAKGHQLVAQHVWSVLEPVLKELLAAVNNTVRAVE